MNTKRKRDTIYTIPISLLSAAIGFFVGEKLLFGRFLQHGMEDYYALYELIFFTLFTLSYHILRHRPYRWAQKIPMGLGGAYLASFLSYHIHILVVYGPEKWLVGIKENPLLIVFTPSCLVSFFVGAIYIASYELFVFLWRTVWKHRAVS